MATPVATPSAGEATEAGKKWVYLFSELDQAEEYVQPKSWDDMKALLGGKGANLAEMTRIGVPVPPGFTVTTEACNAYLAHDRNFPPGMWEQETASMKDLEQRTGKGFGDPKNPLFVSCRSGAKFSMPGMMDTVLNIGLNDETALGFIELTGDPRFVYDSYRRLVQMFGSVVLGVPDEPFEEIIEEKKKVRGVKLDVELTAEEWKEITEEFKQATKKYAGREFPQDPYEQLELATRAVFDSWFGRRAVDYRNATGISHDLGTAVNIQTVVFGNMDNSGTGVAFTRNPVDGTKELYGDYLMNAQGEDVVAGIRNTEPIAKLKDDMPEVYKQFLQICDTLENHYKEMQDVEFTIEQGKLWMLQTRDGKRTARAAIAIAVQLVNEGLIDKKQAVMRVTPEQVDMLLHPQFGGEVKAAAAADGKRIVQKAVNASPGAAVGIAAFDADIAEEWGKEGKAVIMVRPETKPDDVHGMIAAKGILTSRGGATSHAAVVARQFGTPAVCGADVLNINTEQRLFVVDLGEGQTLEVHEGDWLSIDGGTGEVFIGQLETEDPDFESETDLITLLSWADGIRRLGVWANADYPQDAERARRYGAEGIGLCRTEHMFFEESRLPTVQSMIMAVSKARRVAALDALLPMQRGDFAGLFRAMDGNPVIIRLLDPPLHEFLPSHEDLVQELADLKVRLQHFSTLSEIDAALAEIREKEDILERVASLREANPMLGLRGDRLGVIMPEITEMQVRAILEAALQVKREGVDVHPEIMIPLAGHVNELKRMKEIVDEVSAEVFEEASDTVDFKFGTMIEVPRAALTADEMAEEAEFFSFGTNDLTQTTFGISRDDAESKFLIQYVEQGILEENPFQQLDRKGVGKLIEMAVESGRATRPELEVGICGEHGGDPSSIEFCHKSNLNYVSCSPFRVPVARLSAAQAAIRNG